LICSSIVLSESKLLRTAASSIAIGKPSSRTQISATVWAFSWVILKFESTDCARWVNRSTAPVEKRAQVDVHEQKLRRALDWTYQLLDTTDQILLRRLAVFTGGCSLEAVKAVCKGEWYHGGTTAGKGHKTIYDALISLTAHHM